MLASGHPIGQEDSLVMYCPTNQDCGFHQVEIKLIQNCVIYIPAQAHRQRSVHKQVYSHISGRKGLSEGDCSVFFRTRTTWRTGFWIHYQSVNFDAGWCSLLYCPTLHIHPHTAMLYSAMLAVPRGKYCAELQAQCHVKTGPDHVRTGPNLDQTRIEKNSTQIGVFNGPDSKTLKTCGHNCKQKKRTILIIMKYRG